MTAVRAAIETVAFVDAYAAAYRDVFSNVRSFDHFTRLHVGLISDVARKSLPTIGRVTGVDAQALHHFVANADWDVAPLRQRRLQLTRDALAGRSFVLCIDETGDQKYGTVTDYMSRQYIGNLGAIETGLVSVNAYGVLDAVTFPLLFQVFKPDRRLKPDDPYQTKPSIASALVRTLVQQGFAIDLVLADALYGESGPFLQTLTELGLPYVVAIRQNHGVWMPRAQRIRTTRWRPFERRLSDGTAETRYVREVVYGVRRSVRFYHLTSDPEHLPTATTRFVMTNLPGDLRHTLGNLYGLRTWIEYGFKHIKNELGWADHRLTDYAAIERWWELVYSVSPGQFADADVCSGVRCCQGCRRTTGPAAPVVECWQWVETHAQQPAAADPAVLLLVPTGTMAERVPGTRPQRWAAYFDVVHQSRSIALPYSDKSRTNGASARRCPALFLGFLVPGGGAHFPP